MGSVTQRHTVTKFRGQASLGRQDTSYLLKEGEVAGQAFLPFHHTLCSLQSLIKQT